MNVSTKSTEWYKRIILTVCAVFLLCGASFAQNSRVTGRVIDQNGEALVGITVLVQGTTNGTATDGNGEYALNNVPAQGVLEFSGIGYETQNVNVSSRTRIDVKMLDDNLKIEDIVVTAEFGVKRVARSIGAAVQNLKGSDLSESGRDNFVSALQGRVAGIKVTSTSGTPGSSTTVILRNPTSISGNNQPLYVIDGVPMNSSTFDPDNGFANTGNVYDRDLDFGSRGNDINPEDIESMTILKGAAAAALYGSNASNGAIVITTKKGRAGQGRVQYNNSFGWSKAYQYPEIQTKYGNGSYGTMNYYNQNRFGAEYPEGTVLYNNLDAVLQTGFVQRHNLSIDGGSEKVTLRASAGYTNNKGIVKTSSYERFNVTLSGTAKVKEWLAMEGSAQYIKSNTDKVPKGSSGVLARTFVWPSTDNMAVYLTEDGLMRFPDLYADTDVLNPLFMLHKNKYYDESDRFLSSFNVTLTPIEDWFIRAQVGFDVATQTFITSVHPEYASGRNGKGEYNQSKSNFYDPTLDIITGYRKDWDKFGFSVQAGYHQLQNSINQLSVYGSNFLVKDFQSINNCDATTLINKTTTTKRRVQAISGQIEGSWNNMLYLTLRARNDWSSTLPVDNRSYFYPAAELSFIFTELPFMQSVASTVNYLKLRGSIAQVGKDATPLSVYPALMSVTTSGGGYRYDFTGPNYKLKPEMNTAWEVGFEGRFFNNRMDVDFTYYSTKSKDQIINGFRMSYATGFVLNNMNVGTFVSDGIEARIAGDIIRSGDWTLNVGLNLSTNWSDVTYLPENVTEYYNSGTWVVGNIRNGIKVGNPITTITGQPMKRNEAGQVIVDQSTGLPLIDDEWVVLGDREPKMAYGITADLRWKGFTLSAVLDGRIGATVVNGTKRTMMQRGLSWESVKLRESGPVIFDGVLNDGLENSANPTPNNISINYGSLSQGYYANNELWIEKNIQYLRLQEIRLNYRIPTQWLERNTRGLLSAASLYVSANDLYTWTNYSGIDVVGNSNSAAAGGTGGIGFDNYSIAAPRVFMFGVNITF